MFAASARSRSAPQEPSRSADARATLPALARAFRENVSEAGRLVAGVAVTEFGHYELTYIIERVSLPPERIEAVLKRTGTDPETVEKVIGTAAQIWMEKDKAVGIVEGKADTFLRLARPKFGGLSSVQTEQVRNASTEHLDSWLDALLAAKDIDGVLVERTRH